MAAYEALAPLHWDAEEFDFGVDSEEDEPETEGEDLQFLFQEELESVSDDAFSWDGVDSFLEEEIDSSSGDDPMGGNPFRFLGSSEENSEEEAAAAVVAATLGLRVAAAPSTTTTATTTRTTTMTTTTTTAATAEMCRHGAPNSVGTRYLRAVDIVL